MDLKEKYQIIEDFLKSNKIRPLELKGLKGASRAWLLSKYLAFLNGPLLWITKDSREAEDILADFSFFTNEQVALYPGHESLPFVPVMPSPEIIAHKISMLYALSTQKKPLIIVASVKALFELTLPPTVFRKNIEYLQKGEEANREKLLSWLINTGYRHSALVQTRGEFSVRGGVFDFFPPGQDCPVRIDFFGDMVESIRYFDPSSQRSKQELEELEILPASELLYFDDLVDKSQENLIEKAGECGWPARRINELLHSLENRRLAEGQLAFMPLFYKPSSLFDYLPKNVPVVLDDMDSIQKEIKAFWKHAEGLYDTAVKEYRVLHPISSILLEPDRFQNEIRTRPAIYLNQLAMEMASPPLHEPTADLDIIEFHVKKKR
jgi:transcription-repair coupling factor (superfamily II helicase)